MAGSGSGVRPGGAAGEGVRRLAPGGADAGRGALAARFPLAATLVLRSALEFQLDNPERLRKEQRQVAREAARRLTDCAGLAPGIADFGAHPTHGVYVSSLREQHPYAHDFWSEVKKTRSPD